MRLEAEARLAHRRLRELGVHRRDPRVGAVVVAAVDADRPVDAVHHPDVVAGEPPQAVEVEVEGVEEAGARAAGDAVLLDVEAAAPELAFERAQELVAAAGRRRRELVEDGDVGASRAGRAHVELRPHPRGRRGARPSGRCDRAARGFVRSPIDGVP